MPPDELPESLRAAWSAHSALLEKSLAIDERLLRDVLLRKVRFALAPYVVWRAIEVVCGVAFMCVLVPILAAHRAEPLYVVVAGALAAFTVGITASCVALLVGALTLDLGGPVTAIQRSVERVMLVEYRSLKWAVLGGVVLWLPAALLVFEAATGIDALARVHLPWLVANLVLGLAVLAVGFTLSKKYVERTDLGPWARRVVDAVSNGALRNASRHLAELAKFEREDP